MSKDTIDQLIDLTREKNKLLNRMIDIMIKQKEEIEEEKLDELGDNLNKKDDIIRKIDELDRSFLESFSKLKREHSINDLNELDVQEYPNLMELKELVKEVSSSLLTLSLMDKENSESMRRKLEKAKMDLARVKKGKKAYKGYNYKFADSMLIDKRK